MHNIPFPHVRQQTDYSCGAAVSRAVLAFYGTPVPEHTLAAALGTNPTDGTEPERIATLFRQLGFAVFAGRMSVRSLERTLDHNIPVILNIQAWADHPTQYDTHYEDGHYVVATGYDPIRIIVQDPWMDTHQGFIPRRDLDARWHGDSSDHLGIAVKPHNP
jgi:ABC-type bacteriocin/lantibiotic exporter with double-glycine peptidase domain